MAQLFNLSRTYDDSINQPSPEYTAKNNDKGIQGIISAGPIPDPDTEVRCVIQLNKGDGNWAEVGGLSGTGGLVSITKGGPATTPVTITGETFCALEQGWKIRALVTVVNAPPAGIPISFQGNLF